MSRGWCFQSNFIKVTDSLGDKVLREVLPKEMLPIERNLRSFYVLFNILLLEGKMPRTAYYKEEEDVRTKVDEGFISKEIRMAPNVPRTGEYFDRLRDAFMRYADGDGTVSTHREWHHGWLLWHV